MEIRMPTDGRLLGRVTYATAMIRTALAYPTDRGAGERYAALDELLQEPTT